MTLIQDTAAINGITCDLIKHQELICGVTVPFKCSDS